MAFTLTYDKSVFGNKAVVGIKVIADAATAAIPSGLAKIDYYSYGPVSMTTANVHVSPNEGVSNTATVGLISVTGCTAGDEFYLVVYGTR